MRLRREVQEAQRHRTTPTDASDLPIKPMMTQSTPPLPGQPSVGGGAGVGPRSFHAPSMVPFPGGQGQERVTLLRDEYEALVAECGAQELLLAGFQKVRNNYNYRKHIRT